MILLHSCKILMVLCLMEIYRRQAPRNHVEGSNLDKFLKKRDIGNPYDDVVKGIRTLPEATSRSQDKLNDIETPSPVGPPKRDCTFSSEDNHDEHDEEGTTRLAEIDGLPSISTASIRQDLSHHREKITRMATERQELSRMLELLNEERELLRTYGQFAPKKTIEGILGELNEYHKSVLQLVHHNLPKSGGLNEFAIRLKPQCEDGTFHIPKPKGSDTASELIVEAKGKEIKGQDFGKISRSLPDCHTLGHTALYTVPRENVEAQKKASRELPSPQQSPSLTENMGELRNEPVDMISDKLKDASVSELSRLLQSITFHPDIEELSISERAIRRILKSCFQTFVFQELQYMYKSELLSKGHIRQFFSENKIQEITGIHLVDHFNMYHTRFFKRFTFVPDFNFILNHWHTKHLHKSLEVLEEKHQAFVFYTALKETVKHYYLLETFYGVTSDRHQKFFLEDNFAKELRKWQQLKTNSESISIETDSQLFKSLTVILNCFQNPTPDPKLERSLDFKRIVYLLDYYILKFINSHHPDILQQMFVTTEEYDILSTQLSLLQVGLELNQNLNLSIDYEDYFHLPWENELIVPDQILNARSGMLYVELKRLSEIYMSFWHETSILSKKEANLESWLNGRTVSSDIISFLTMKAKCMKESSSPKTNFHLRYRNSWMVEKTESAFDTER